MSRDRLPSTLVGRYYLFQAASTFGFFSPVFTLFLLHRNLSYTEIGVLGSVSAALVLVGEVPTGYVADRIGRRRGLALGTGLLGLSLLGHVFARSFATFVGLWVVWALGRAFRSGSGDAWLYDALADRLRESEYTRVRGRGGAVNQWVSALTMLAAGGLYAAAPWLPFLVAGLLLLGAAGVALSFPAAGTRESDDADRLTVLDALPVVRERLTRPPLRSFVAYVALFYGALAGVRGLIQPIAVYTLDLPEAGLGPLYFGFTVAAAGASYVAADLERLLSTRGVLAVVPGVVVVFMLLPLAFAPAAFPLFFLARSGRSAVAPVVTGYLNDRVDAVGRATVLSAASMAYALVRLPVKPLTGVVADWASPLFAVAVLGVGFLVLGGALFAVARPAGDDVTHAASAAE